MSEKKRVVIRADGDRQIGMGHFIRSMALAEMIKGEFSVHFATIDPSVYQEKLINKSCDGIISLPPDSSHSDIFLDQLKKDDIVVLDNYFFDTSYQKEIKNKGCKLIVIDDIHDKKFAGDIIINHSPSASPADYVTEDYSRLLLGPRYVLLRPEFLKAAKTEPYIPKSKSVLLCFGGSDKYNLSYDYIRFLDEIMPELSVNVILGAESKGKDIIEEYISRNNLQSKVRIYRNLSASSLVELINNSYLAIVPSSGIMYEILAVRRQMITGYYVENQLNISDKIINDDKGIYYAGDLRKPDKEFFRKTLNKAFETDYREVVNYQTLIIDGHSGKRILNEFLSLK